MKRFFTVLSKSFLLAFIAFSMFSGIIMLSVYSCNYTFEPLDKETTLLLIGLDEKEKRVFSLTVVNTDYESKEITFLSIPDNLWIEADEMLLQDMFYKKGISRLREKTEALIGTKINRFIAFDCEKIEQIVNSTGEFLFNLSYPFQYNGQKLSGTIMLDGRKAAEMLSYDEYDATDASVSKISLAFIQAFLSENAEKLSNDKVKNALFSNDFCNSDKTNCSEKELTEYITLLLEYNKIKHQNVTLEGEKSTSSSRTFFIPKYARLKESIFN